MVGAIADWFAVTALFKHPLGLPIPHTALIPKRKDDLGRSLEQFMAENFLQEQVIRERLASATVSKRLGEWLVQPANAARVVREGSALAAIGLRRVREEDVVAVVNEVIIPRLQREPFSPVLGGLLQEIVADDAHHGLVDLALEEGHRWLVHNQETFTEVVGERAPWWAPQRLNTAVTERLHLEAIRWVADIRRRPAPPRARGAGQHAGAARRRPADRRGDAGACGAAEDPAARAPAAGHRRHGDLERAPRSRCTEALDDTDGPLRAARGARAGRLRRAARPRRGAARPAGRLGLGPRGVRGRALRRRADRRDHADHRALGRPARPPARSSCTSAATCSSSGSTAPSSAAWSGS